MTQDTELTTVIFRKFQSGDHEIIALFPYVPWSSDSPSWFGSYLHVGQHGRTDARIIDITRPASPDEYLPLKRELEAEPFGYRFRVLIRIPSDAARVREAEWRRILEAAPDHHQPGQL